MDDERHRRQLPHRQARDWEYKVFRNFKRGADAGNPIHDLSKAKDVMRSRVNVYVCVYLRHPSSFVSVSATPWRKVPEKPIFAQQVKKFRFFGRSRISDYPVKNSPMVPVVSHMSPQPCSPHSSVLKFILTLFYHIHLNLRVVFPSNLTNQIFIRISNLCVECYMFWDLFLLIWTC